MANHAGSWSNGKLEKVRWADGSVEIENCAAVSSSEAVDFLEEANQFRCAFGLIPFPPCVSFLFLSGLLSCW